LVPFRDIPRLPEGWTMKVKIKAGTRGWYEVKFQGINSVTFKCDIVVDVEPYQTSWYKRIGEISGLPRAHPGILINEIFLPRVEVTSG
jgi:hypothetical protein